MSNSLATLDWIVIAGYFLLLLGIAAWVILQKQENSEDYFLAGRNMGWFVVGASIFASNIGSEHVVGLAGSGAGDKFPLLIYELHAWVVVLLGWLFLPFYVRSGVFTMPEFLEKRFNPRARWFLSLFSLAAYVLTKVSVTLYAGGIVISTLLDISFMQGALATVILTGIYTVLGGMRAVVYTETLQAMILVIGAATLTFLGLNAAGGWGSIVEEVGPQYMDMWRSSNDPEFPWHWLVLSSTIVGIWYWCTDQVIVQRVLTAKNIKEGRRGTIFGAFLKLMPVFLFLIPGVIALVLKQRGELAWDTPDQAFPALMMQILPAGLRGLVAAGLMAALMSSLASVFNSCSTLFTVDIYKKIRPETTEKQMVQVGRIATTVVVLLGILWVPIIEQLAGGSLYNYLQNVQSYIAPPITAVFLLGIFSSRINSNGALVTLFSGLAIAAVRLILEVFKGSLNPDSFLFTIADMNFLKFSSFFFLYCVAAAVVVSLLTAKPIKANLAGLTFGTLSEEQKESNRSSYTWIDIVASLFVVSIVVFIMIYFS
ncbi:sodium:solute symporter [Flavilitoribacter nigricans]|uniref:Na+/glucose cotransporter n=1 Tax=Flavilitoribacter nigricans (strain ATCC 23147 / DSM 23189 / NBRC 102662 / NCIMB 1420 / SS-2) TaxID=1122177 RepID=A0A2D0N6B9_FLAN2|nr:sodium:solute symporter [Flavilitoribacter nigricans]PHN04007.1 Na+/glucose cotransporter [Flavilitoribacter nigricans DSM 23189 = NBRC 102662]